MQVLDQEIALPRTLAQQGADLSKRLGIDLAALRGLRRPAPAAARLVGNDVNCLAPSSLSRGSLLHPCHRADAISL
jgi:hypothetical protein